jgi:hypothetical protein
VRPVSRCGEAEALMRAVLGEVALFDEVHLGWFSYSEIG